jgi:hypothetical protein
MKSWSSFVVGLVLGIALTAGVIVARFDLRRPVAAAPSGGARAASAKPQPGADVVINGRALAQGQKDEFLRRYGVAPAPGTYWYDAKSGLWGLAGQPAAGFLLPGHDFGALAADASGGRTGVFLNGREIPPAEVQILAALAGAVLPGRYWLDGTGNYGYEGMAVPVGNLYALAAANAAAYGGGGGGGDNFWSSRFARGNSNADNSQGYVSIPGVGTVTYGM